MTDAERAYLEEVEARCNEGTRTFVMGGDIDRFAAKCCTDIPRLIAMVRAGEQPEVVRCKDCINGHSIPKDKRRFVTSDRVLSCSCWRGDYDIKSDLSLTWDDGFCDEGKMDGQRAGEEEHG